MTWNAHKAARGITPRQPDERPAVCRRELLHALLLAALCALAFLRAGVLPTRAVVPFPPERFEPLRSEVIAGGELSLAEIERGAPAMGDKYNQSLAWDRILQDRLRDGDLPLWTRELGGGVPFVPQMAQVYQPWNLLLLLPIDATGIYGLWYLLHLIAWGTGAYWFLRRTGSSHVAALLGLTIATLGLWTQARVHHNVILSAALPLWPLLSLIDGAVRSGRCGPGRIAAIALGVGISWSGGFAPVSLQVCGMACAFALFRALQFRRAAPLVKIAVGFALGGVLALPQMGPTLLAATESARVGSTPEHLAALGLSWTHLQTLWWPDLFAWPAIPDIGLGEPALQAADPIGIPWAALERLPASKLYPPEVGGAFNYPETAFAVGIPATLLALRAVWGRDRLAHFAAGLALLGFGLATATTPFLELSALLPGARAGDLRRFLFLVAICLTILAARGADRLPLRPWVLALLGLVVAGLSAWWFAVNFAVAGDPQAFRELHASALARPLGGVDWDASTVLAAMAQNPRQTDQNLAMLLWTFGRSAVVAAAAAALLWWARGAARVLGLALVGALELLGAGVGTIVPVPVERVQRLPALLEPVAVATRDAARTDRPRPRLFRLERQGIPADRSLLFPPNLGAFHGFEDLSVYSPLPKRRMEELFAAIEPESSGVAMGGAGVLAIRRSASLRHPLLDLLGCRFVIAAGDVGPIADGQTIVDVTPEAAAGDVRLYERRSVLPRATFVDRSATITARDARIAAVADPDRDPTAHIVLEDAQAPPVSGDGQPDARVSILAHRDESVSIAVDAGEPGYLRLADPWDAGWVATVDGQPAPLLIADHYLRAVFLTPGSHVVEFRYEGPRATIWPRLGLLGLVAVAICAAVGARRRFGK